MAASAPASRRAIMGGLLALPALAATEGSAQLRPVSAGLGNYAHL